MNQNPRDFNEITFSEGSTITVRNDRPSERIRTDHEVRAISLSSRLKMRGATEARFKPTE